MLKSRTVWGVIFLFLLGGFEKIVGFMPTELYLLITAILAAATAYFRVKPKQAFK